MHRPATIALPALLILACAAASAASAGEPAAPAGSDLAYVKIDGIAGEETMKGYEGWIKAEELAMSLDRDTGTKLVSKLGLEDRPRSLRIAKAVDKATPLISKRVRKGSKIKEVAIHLVRADGKGGTQHYFTILLTNVSVVSNNIEFQNGRASEGVLFDYESVVLRSVTGETEAEVDK